MVTSLEKDTATQVQIQEEVVVVVVAVFVVENELVASCSMTRRGYLHFTLY